MADRERIVERTSVYINRFHTSTSRSGNSRIFLSIFLFINVIIIYIFFFFCFSSRDILVEVVQTNTISTSDGSSSN